MLFKSTRQKGPACRVGLTECSWTHGLFVARSVTVQPVFRDFEDLSVYMFPLELDRLPLYVLESELGAFELAACPVLHVSRSAPSIPRDSQCYGYDEVG